MGASNSSQGYERREQHVPIIELEHIELGDSPEVSPVRNARNGGRSRDALGVLSVPRQPTFARRLFKDPCTTRYLVLGSITVLVVTIVATAAISLAIGKRLYSPSAAGGASSYDPSLQPLIVASAAVAADDPLCSTIGKDTLEKGGNAVDAAISTAVCLGLVHPMASGIGGGAFIVIHMANGTEDFIDGRETAPASAFETMFVGRPQNSLFGGQAVAVPGELRGMQVAHSKYGRLPWRALFTEVIQLATKGFPVGKFLADTLQDERNHILKRPAMASVFTRNGALLREGDLLKRPDLARALTVIAENGSDAFYSGAIAQGIVQTIKDSGGNMTLADLKGFQAKSSAPLSFFFCGLRFVGAPLPSSGGITMAMILNILERYELSPTPSAQDYHLLAEAFKHAFADRMALGDPDFVNVTEIVSDMISKEYAAQIRRRIRKYWNRQSMGLLVKFLFRPITGQRICLWSIQNAIQSR